MQLIVPTDTIRFNELESYVWYQTATTTEVRFDVYSLSAFDDDAPVLLSSSDYVTITGRNSFGNWSTSDLVTFSFDYVPDLVSGRIYGFTLTERNSSIPSTELSIGAVFDDPVNSPYDTTTFWSYGTYYDNDTSESPWTIGNFNNVESTTTAWTIR